MLERLVGVSLLRHLYNCHHQFDCVFAADCILGLLHVLFEVGEVVLLDAIHTTMVNLLDRLTNPFMLRSGAFLNRVVFEVLAPMTEIGRYDEKRPLVHV